MSPSEFAARFRPQAEAVSAGTGLDPYVLLAQWSIETGWGNQINNLNNLGNIRCLGGVPCAGGFAQFPSLASFVSNCVATWHNGYYGEVLAAAALQPPNKAAQLAAIARSPWDAGHYGGSPAKLLEAYFAIAPAPPTPTPGAREMQTFTLRAGEHIFIPGPNQETLINAVVDGVPAAGDAYLRISATDYATGAPFPLSLPPGPAGVPGWPPLPPGCVYLTGNRPNVRGPIQFQASLGSIGIPGPVTLYLENTAGTVGGSPANVDAAGKETGEPIITVSLH